MVKKKEDELEEIEEKEEEIQKDLSAHYAEDEKEKKEGNKEWKKANNVEKVLLRKLTRIEKSLTQSPEINQVAEVPIPKPPKQKPQEENEAEIEKTETPKKSSFYRRLMG